VTAVLNALKDAPTVVVVIAVGAVLLGLTALVLAGLTIFSKREDPFRRLRLLIREFFSGLEACRRELAARPARPVRAARAALRPVRPVRPCGVSLAQQRGQRGVSAARPYDASAPRHDSMTTASTELKGR
jgi:hypothetical protein